jgi:transcription elongation factor Elf1
LGAEKEKTWLQCTNCGHIHIVERKIPIEKVIINSHCERCGHGKALNCGYSEDDSDYLRDHFLDSRYYY